MFVKLIKGTSVKKAKFLLTAMVLLALFLFSCGEIDSEEELNAADINDDDDDDNDDTSDDDDDDNNDDDNNDDDSTPDALQGIYNIAGVDDVHGSYTGQAEFRSISKGEYQYTRLVKYDNLSFVDDIGEEYTQIETAWSGAARLDHSTVRIELTLKRAHFIKGYNGLEREYRHRNPLEVTGVFSLDGEDIEGLFDSPENIVSVAETGVRVSDIGSEPIWKNEDTYYESHSDPPSFFKDLLNILLSGYHDLPFYDDYRDREEFKRYVHFTPQFRTGLDYYRANPDGLRVAGKVLDVISMKESQMRADAFKYTLAEKAEFLDLDTQEKNINKHGMLANYYIGTDPPEHMYDYDSLLWTGTYVASQAYRYLATGEPEALANMLHSLDGLIVCVEITGDPAEFARTLRTVGEEGNKNKDSETGKYNAWNPGTEEFEGIEWRYPGNNDMLHGIFYGYTAALLALPDDPAYDEYRDRMEQTVVSLAENSVVVTESLFNPIPINYLAYLFTGDNKFLTAYKQAYNLALKFWLSSGNGLFFLWGISDWSGQHLNTNALQTLALLDLIQGKPVSEIVKAGFVNGMYNTRSVRQPLVAISAHAFATPGPEFDAIWEDAVWSLREMPTHKRAVAMDIRVNGQWCASPLPSLFWKLDWSEGGRHQGLYGTPIFMRGDTSCWYNNNPYSISRGESTTYAGGADFLHAYWLGRYFGVLTGNE